MPPSPGAFESVAWGCPGLPSPSGPHPCPSEPGFCQSPPPKGGHPGPVGGLLRCLWSRSQITHHTPFLGMRAPSASCPHPCVSGGCFLPFSSSAPHPPQLPLIALSAQSQEWCQGSRTSGWAWALVPSSPSLLPALAQPTSTVPAIHLPLGLGTQRAGGRAVGWACVLSPKGACSCRPPALPEPGPCAACPPCPFVPKAGGGGRPTMPEARHQP